MAFTKIVSPGIDTTGSYTVQELNTVGVMTAGTVQVGSATTVHTTGIDLGSGNITSHNINSTGIITATSFVGPVSATNGTFSGNVSIGGTLTYEDVTNIDSVGLITARDGINVTGGSVGINTTVPAEKLDVLGTIRASAGTNQYMHMYPVAGAGYFDVRNQTSYPSIAFRQIGSGGTQEALRIDSSGQIGLGTNSPNGLLSLTAASGRLLTLRNSTTGSGSTDGSYLALNGSDLQIANAESANTVFYTADTERLRITSGGIIKFATSNSSTDYLEWGNNPRLVLQTPSGLNGLRIYSDTTPFEVAGGASTRKISVGGDPNYDISISGDYSLSSGGYDSSPKVFLNATRHDGSSTVTSFQTSIQAVSVSNTAGDGYLGLGASATPDDLVIRPSGNIGIGENSPDRLLHIKGASSTAYSGGSDTADYNFLKIENTTNDKSAGIFFAIGSNGEAAITATEVADGDTDIAFQNRGGGVRSEKLRIKSGGEITSGNLSINAFANGNTPSGYSQYQSDNHANTLFGQNLKLGASAGSGNHQIEIINQHPSIGGAGMYIGGNGSNQENAINFYAEAANQSPGTDVTANRRAQIASSAYFTWVEPRNLSGTGMSYLRTFGFTFNLQDGETETVFYNPDGYRRIWYQMYFQSGHGSNGYGYILANMSRYGLQVHDVDWHVSYTSYAFSGSVNGNVNHNGIKFTRSGYSNTNITYYVIVKAFSPAGGNPYSNSGLTDPSYRYFNSGY